MKIILLLNYFPFMILPILFTFIILFILNMIYLHNYLKSKKTDILYCPKKLILSILILLFIIFAMLCIGVALYTINNSYNALWGVLFLCRLVFEIIIIPSPGVFIWMSVLSIYTYRKR